MNIENGKISVLENIQPEALDWLRNSLINTLEIAPLSEKPKKATRRALKRVPDWILLAWANALNIDYVNTSKVSPEFPEHVNSHTGKYHAQQYLEVLDAVAAGSCLQQLVRRVVRLIRYERLLRSALTRLLPQGIIGVKKRRLKIIISKNGITPFMLTAWGHN